MNRSLFTALALTLVYVALTRHSFAWLAHALFAPAARGNLVVLLVVAIACARRLRGVQIVLKTANCAPRAGTSRLEQFRGSATDIVLSRAPLAIVASASVAYAVARWVTPWDRLHAVIAIVGVYGLVGLFVSRGTWRRGLAVLALGLVALPFGEQLDVLVGYPLRLFVTDVAQSILEHVGAHGTSRATILVFDSGAAQIDVPCSGVKSLWAGALLALSVPLVLMKRFDVRWGVATVGLAVALCVGNVLRIVVLVLLACPAKQPVLAEILHRPLGCVGFIATAIAYGGVMARAAAAPIDSEARASVPSVSAFAVIALVVAMTCVGPATASAGRPVSEAPFVTLPTLLVSETLSLSSAERAFYTQQGADRAGTVGALLRAFYTQQGADRASKVRFTWNGNVRGSLIIVRSAHAAGQHPPEQCLTSAGHVIRSARTALFGSTLSVRLLELGKGAAVSWFQSGYATHGDYAERVWASGTWVQVSILFNDVDADHVPFDLVYALYRAIAVTYQGDPDA